MTNYHNSGWSPLNRLTSNSIFVYHHLGLGDHLVCNGLVRAILEQSTAEHLYLPVKKHNYTSVRSMYLDECRIVCLPVSGDADVPSLSQAALADKVYRAGFEKTRSDWDVSFYDSVGIPFSDRWNRFKINRNLQRESELANLLKIDDQPYIVIHDTASIGRYERLDVDAGDCRVIRVEKHTDNLLDWCGVIEGAEAFHGIDSSVVHLAQSLDVKRGVLHASTPTPPQLNPNGNWSMKEYS